MKLHFFAAALAALAIGASLPAAAHDFNRHRQADYSDYRRDRDFRGDWRRERADITIFANGRVLRIDRDDRLFHRLIDRPYNFMPGLVYEYTDRCNRWGCVVFVYDNWNRRPIYRMFAPHLRLQGYTWRARGDFDRNYRDYGRFDRDRDWYEEWRRDVERNDNRR